MKSELHNDNNRALKKAATALVKKEYIEDISNNIPKNICDYINSYDVDNSEEEKRVCDERSPKRAVTEVTKDIVFRTVVVKDSEDFIWYNDETEYTKEDLDSIGRDCIGRTNVYDDSLNH